MAEAVKIEARREQWCVFIPIDSNEMSTRGDIWTTFRVRRLLTRTVPTFFFLITLDMHPICVINKKKKIFWYSTLQFAGKLPAGIPFPLRWHAVQLHKDNAYIMNVITFDLRSS